MTPYVIIAFYQFAPLNDYEFMREPLLQTMRDNNVKGTIILASEGVNGSFCGLREEIAPLIAHLRSFPGLKEIVFKETYNDFNPFAKAKVKLRNEIVTMGVSGIDPLTLPGTHLNPDEWNALISDPEVIIIDTRNDYEVKLGTFKNAINPETENFRDFPAYVEQHLTDKKDKKIAMFCTGGIRCEKSTSYLKTLGFNEVYQLNGGILNYLESVDQENSLWEGSCFVFDDRVAVDKDLKGYEKGSIDLEWKNKHRKKSDV
ncbi:putative rhodanese-related sulfurtransferase [Legionella massiliensis]|uniref:tRNA uridine(34) hydroxylase n=1 Tax=Legionella massiliensis TaxID=1034943 RepID=A0A078KVL7_9GAMM|nr:rhodanese-related sulfurtransferase [Legionella massiliensis]CDZ75814.1 putative rhodanese-related sulfurtransferase [Legionella massiliensis]CEE11552.1 Thiosulfate sulfurtransferase GlpE [Legionella massiliensis]